MESQYKLIMTAEYMSEVKDATNLLINAKYYRGRKGLHKKIKFEPKTKR